jgi:charged multivesicular body protein 2A
MLDKSIREIERERQGLQAQEKKLITEIKKTAKEGQMVFSFLFFSFFFICSAVYAMLHCIAAAAVHVLLAPNLLQLLFISLLILILQGAVKVMAKDLIRTRHQITKFYALKSQLQGVSLRIQV